MDAAGWYGVTLHGLLFSITMHLHLQGDGAEWGKSNLFFVVKAQSIARNGCYWKSCYCPWNPPPCFVCVCVLSPTHPHPRAPLSAPSFSRSCLLPHSRVCPLLLSAVLGLGHFLDASTPPSSSWAPSPAATQGIHSAYTQERSMVDTSPASLVLGLQGDWQPS